MTAGVWEDEGVGEMDGGRGGIGGGSKDSGEESTLITSGWKHHNKSQWKDHLHVGCINKDCIKYSCYIWKILTTS